MSDMKEKNLYVKADAELQKDFLLIKNYLNNRHSLSLKNSQVLRKIIRDYAQTIRDKK